MQFDRSQIRQPNQRSQIVGEDVVDGTAVSFAPDRRSLHPVGAVLGRIFLVEEFFVHAVRITLAGERASGQMRHHRRRNPHIVIDDLLLSESRRGIQNFFQIRQFKVSSLNFDGRIH